MTNRKSSTTRAKSRPLTREEIEEIVAAAVMKTFSNLGIHLATEADVDSLRKDLEYTRAWRLAIQRGGRMGMGTAIAIMVSGLLGALLLGIKAVFHVP
jgi:uncharacterized membrane protein